MKGSDWKSARILSGRLFSMYFFQEKKKKSEQQLQQYRKHQTLLTVLQCLWEKKKKVKNDVCLALWCSSTQVLWKLLGQCVSQVQWVSEWMDYEHRLGVKIENIPRHDI